MWERTPLLGTLSAGGNYTITYNGSNFTITKQRSGNNLESDFRIGCNGETSIVLTAVSLIGLAVNYSSSNQSIATVSNNSISKITGLHVSQHHKQET
jgi:hypothetical protein